MEPHYEYYSLEELEDAGRQIDARRYPERFKLLQAELLRRRLGSPAASLVGEIFIWAFGAVLVALFSLSFWLAGVIVGVVGVTAFVAYALRSIDGYICTECGAQYAPWQIKN